MLEPRRVFFFFFGLVENIVRVAGVAVPTEWRFLLGFFYLFGLLSLGKRMNRADDECGHWERTHEDRLEVAFRDTEVRRGGRFGE